LLIKLLTTSELIIKLKMSNQIKIDHNWGDLKEGQTYVMNLRDTDVLNEDSEELIVENASLQSAFRQKIQQRRK